MPLPESKRPLIDRSTAVLLIGTAVSVLAIPRCCFADPGQAPCKSLTEVELKDTWGRRLRLIHLRCAGEDQIDICDDARCAPDVCAPAGIGFIDDPTVTRPRFSDGWVEPPSPLPRADGGQDALLVRRHGNGGYPHIVRYFLADGRPACESVGGLDTVVRHAAKKLRTGESFGFRGGEIEVVGHQLFLTKGVYRPEDPNCCPSLGRIRLLAVIRDGQLVLEGTDRLAPIDLAVETARFTPDAHGGPPTVLD